MKKALFFDVDGTLMNREHKIPESALKALELSREAGNYVFINSGRTSGLLNKLMKEIPADGFLCGCGTELFFRGERVYYHSLSEDDKKEIKELQMKYGLICLLEGQNGTYLKATDSLYEKYPGLKDKASKEICFVEQEGGFSDEDYDSDYQISKFCCISTEESDIAGLYEQMSGRYHIIDRGNFFYEIIPEGHGKGYALDRMLEYLGLSREDSLAFGDSSNDLDMFMHAGYRVAMKEHSSVLDPYTEYVTDSVDNDGIWKAMDMLKLIG